MPFIVTTKRTHVWVDMPTGEDDDGVCSATTTERRAFAALEDAQTDAWKQLLCLRGLHYQVGGGRSEWVPFFRAAKALPESGGTVGPLPDGSLIEVEAVGMDALAAAVIADLHDNGFTDSEIIAAFNAKQAA